MNKTFNITAAVNEIIARIEKLQAIHIARRSGERILELQKSLDLLDVTLSRFS